MEPGVAWAAADARIMIDDPLGGLSDQRCRQVPVSLPWGTLSAARAAYRRPEAGKWALAIAFRGATQAGDLGLPPILPRRLCKAARLAPQRAGRLLHGRVVHGPPGSLLDLFVTFPASPGADNEPGGESDGEHDPISHQNLFSRSLVACFLAHQ